MKHNNHSTKKKKKKNQYKSKYFIQKEKHPQTKHINFDKRIKIQVLGSYLCTFTSS
jgi:hypothetical protein